MIFASPFSSDVGFACIGEHDTNNFQLHPAEAAILSTYASKQRQAEFALGRQAAYLALQKIGFSKPPPILRGTTREPLWPAGIVGSISHGAGFAMAACAKMPQIIGLGVDLQAIRPRSSVDIAKYVCTDAERQWISDDWQRRLLMIFSAKESAYKAFYPLTRSKLRFKDVTLSWDAERRCFTGRLEVSISRDFLSGFQFEVGVNEAQDLLFTYILLS